jgi:hypothetical protein
MAEIAGDPDCLIAMALIRARDPEPMQCPVSGEMMYAPLDKLSIGVYNRSIGYLEDDSIEAIELLKLAELL